MSKKFEHNLAKHREISERKANQRADILLQEMYNYSPPVKSYGWGNDSPRIAAVYPHFIDDSTLAKEDQR